MKPNISSLVLVVFVIIPWGSLRAADDTAELQKLKSSYSAASERALTPIKVTYKRELERLMQTYTKAGKLEAALAVKAELELLSEPAATGSSIADSSKKDEQASKRELEKLLTTGTWTFYQGGESEEQKGKPDHSVELGKDHNAQRKGKSATKWEINKDGELVYMADLAPWVCRLKRVSDTLWVGVGIGTNASGLNFVHLEKVAP